MKRHILSLLMPLCGILGAHAQQDLVDCVIVELNNGESLSLALRHTPKATFENNFVVMTAGDFKAAYDKALLNRFYFKKDVDGIHAIADAENVCKGSIYDTHGRKVADFEGTIDSATLQKGVYIVKTTSGKSFKVMQQ